MSKNEKDTQMNRRDFGKLIAAGSFVAVTGAIMPEAVFGQGGGHGEFRNMRRKERALSEDETWAVMKSCSYGFLGTSGEGGQPHVVPISFVVYDKNIYFHTPKTGLKIDNMKTNPKVSFAVVENAQPLHLKEPFDFDWYFSSAIAYGNVKVVTGDFKKEIMTKHFVPKYFPEVVDGLEKYYGKFNKVIDFYEIDVKQITGKANKPDTELVIDQYGNTTTGR